MGKLAEILHELIDGVHHLTDNRRGELHAAVDELDTPAKPEPSAEMSAAPENTVAPETPADGTSGA